MANKTTPESSRRKFLSTSIKAGIGLTALGNPLLANSHLSKHLKSPHPLKILILGGTGFLGPQQVAYAIQRGHSITIFNRGKTKPTVQKHFFREVEHLIGDRENDLHALEGSRKWDAVIDNSGMKTHWTKKTAELLKDRVENYLYISSIAVYNSIFPGRLMNPHNWLLNQRKLVFH